MSAADIAKGLDAHGPGPVWSARCPAHDDQHASLSITDSNGKAPVRCHAGCAQDAVIDALKARGLWEQQQQGGLTVADLARAKALPEALLRESGFADDIGRQGQDVVRMTYRDASGKATCIRYRGALNGHTRFGFRNGDTQQLFGLHRLRAGEPVIIVEAETDTLALWDAGFNAVGVPGADAWKDDKFAPFLESCPELLVHIEPDKGGEKFRAAFERSKLKDRVIFWGWLPARVGPPRRRQVL